MSARYKTALYIGAGEKASLLDMEEAERILLIEPRKEAVHNLYKIAGKAHVEILEAVVSSNADVSLNYYSLPEFSSLNKPSGLLTLYPNLQQQASNPVAVINVQDLLRQFTISGSSNLLVLDANGSEMRILEELQALDALQLFSELRIRCGREALYDGAADPELLRSLLVSCHFEPCGEIDSDDPDIQIVRYGQDTNSRLLEQLQTELQKNEERAADSEQKLEKRTDELSKAQKRIDDLEKSNWYAGEREQELKDRLEQLEKTAVEQEKNLVSRDAELAAAQQQVHELEESRRQLKKQSEQREQELQALKEELDKLTSIYQQEKEKKDEQHGKLKTATETLERVENDLKQSNRTVQSLEKKLSEKEKIQKSRQEQLSQIEIMNKQYSSENANLKQVHVQLEIEYEKMKAQVDLLKQLMQSS